MKPEELQQQWQEQAEEAMSAMSQWRVAQPKATLAEIEQAVDEQINRLRARMIEQAAQASAAAEGEATRRMVCEQCGQTLQARERARRKWQTHGEQQVEVERTYVTCPQRGGGFFPWWEECGPPVKLVAIGAVERRKRKGEEEIVTIKLTYFARIADAATFADQASAEVPRRGIERAK